jgi:nucleoside-diphosphate-sugar epimerase
MKVIQGGEFMESGQRVIIFGGTGFIGTHLTQYLLQKELASHIILVDIQPPRNEAYTRVLQAGLENGSVKFVSWDVRHAIPESLIAFRPGLIFNLAAIHREPGHEPKEYYETNLKGAENVCAFASDAGCDRLVFTSSISPYGPSEESKNENSLPVPETAYGGSKLAAEKIHLGWNKAAPGRRLLILRPGVVFGPGEGGNVTRLVRSLIAGYFVYVGNRHTRKSGGYVKELCRVMEFGLDRLSTSGAGSLILNFSLDPAPALEDYVQAICRTAAIKRSPLSIPRSLLMGVSHVAQFGAVFTGRQIAINPTRVRKLFRSTNIDPSCLREFGYVWKFTLDAAFQDWKRDMPSDFENRRGRIEFQHSAVPVIDLGSTDLADGGSERGFG